MNVRFDPEESEALRKQAAAERRSMQDVARAAVREYVERHAHQSAVRDSAQRNATQYHDVLRRLGSL